MEADLIDSRELAQKVEPRVDVALQRHADGDDWWSHDCGLVDGRCQEARPSDDATRDETRFQSDPEYHKGWQEGHDACFTTERRTPAGMPGA
jgi:hypothetical protein